MKFRLLVSALLLFTLFANSSARAATLEERVLQLENRLTELAQENAELKKQLGYTKGKASAAVVLAQGKETKLAIGGFIQAHAEFGDSPDARFAAADRFLLRRARLGVKGTFAEHFDFVVQADFGNNSISGINAYRAQLTDCAITWNRYPLATITAGQFKTPYGYEQLMSDTKNPFVERSLPNDQLTLGRQVGAMVSGAALEKRLNYSAALFNGNGANNGGNDNDQFLYVGRVNGTVAQSDKARLGVGLNAFSTRDNGSFLGR
jgi:phosphate-selective porin